MQQGWIKLHRSIRDNDIFNDPQLLRLWIICLTEASHKEREQLVGKQVVHLMPGQFITGRFAINELYNNGLEPKDKVKGEKTIYRWLESLESAGYLTIKKTTKYSVVSITNWDYYQRNDQQSDQQMTNKVTTNKKLKNDKENNSPAKAVPHLPYKEIIEYLNSKTGKSFKHTSQASQKTIKARFNEGYALEDFKRVIEIKTSQWLNTDMEKYLRVSTLFGNKMDSYLNEEAAHLKQPAKRQTIASIDYNEGEED